MKVEFLGAYGGSTTTTFLTSFLIDDFLAVDAGCLTQTLSLERQAAISDVLISHTHLDHTLSVPFLVDNMFDVTESPLRLWARPVVIDAMRKHLFNDVIWPDFSVLPTPDNPRITWHPIETEQTFTIKKLKITAVPVNHVVPTTAFFVENTKENATVLFTSDTSTTDRVWEMANAYTNLKAVVVDCSFPNNMEQLAEVSGHMTPKLLAADLRKLKKQCDVLIYHIKPNYMEQMLAQLNALRRKRLITDLQGRTFNY